MVTQTVSAKTEGAAKITGVLITIGSKTTYCATPPRLVHSYHETKGVFQAQQCGALRFPESLEVVRESGRQSVPS